MKLHCSVILKGTFYAAGCLTTVLMCHLHRACKHLELGGKQTAIFLPAAWNSSHLSRTGRRQHDPTGCPSPSMPKGVFASWTEDWMEMQVRNGRGQESRLLFGSCPCEGGILLLSVCSRIPPSHFSHFRNKWKILQTIFFLHPVCCTLHHKNSFLPILHF